MSPVLRPPTVVRHAIHKHCYIRAVTSEIARPRSVADLPDFWRHFLSLRDRMEHGITEAYAELGIENINPRFTRAVMFLADGPLTIRELAERAQVTHSAMSQSVAAMRKAGLVTTEIGEDARARVISLTERGREVAPLLWDEWYATEAVVTEVERETGMSLDAWVEAMDRALDRRSFSSRLRDRLHEQRHERRAR